MGEAAVIYKVASALLLLLSIPVCKAALTSDKPLRFILLFILYYAMIAGACVLFDISIGGWLWRWSSAG